MFPCPLVAWLQNSCCGYPHGLLLCLPLKCWRQGPRFSSATRGRINGHFISDWALSYEKHLLLKGLWPPKCSCSQMTWDSMDFIPRRSKIAFSMWKGWVCKIGHELGEWALEKSHDFRRQLCPLSLWHDLQDKPCLSEPTDNCFIMFEVTYYQRLLDEILSWAGCIIPCRLSYNLLSIRCKEQTLAFNKDQRRISWLDYHGRLLREGIEESKSGH